MSIKKSSAWRWFALFIKERDGWTCITCGRRYKDARMNAGHFIQADGHLNTYFNEENVNAQCSGCNIWGQTTILEYRRALNRKYGDGTDEKLEKLGKVKVKRPTNKELLIIAKTYRDKYRNYKGGHAIPKRIARAKRGP